MRHSRPFAAAWPALAILLAGAILRLIDLAGWPPGMPFDEIAQAETALGGPPAWLASGGPLFSAIQTASLWLFGHNLIGVRWPAATLGLLALALLIGWACRACGRDVALIAGGFMAIGFWPLALSHVGIDAALPPALAALASLLVSRAATRLPSAGKRQGQQTMWGRIGAGLAAALAVLPLRWQNADPQALVDGAGRAILLWTHQGDAFFHLNVGEWPVFNIGLAVVFVIGLLAAPPIQRSGLRARLTASLPALWLIAGFAQTALARPDQGFRAASAALPATYLTLALGFDLLRRLALERFPRLRWQPILLAVLAFSAAESLWTAFAIAPNDPAARRDANAAYRLMAARLAEEPPPAGAAIATTEPHRLPPALFSFLRHGDAPIRWFDPASALVVSGGEGTTPVFIPDGAAVAERIDNLVLANLPPPEMASHPDGAPAYAIYQLPSGEGLIALLPPFDQGVWIADPLAFPPDDPDGLRQSLTLPVTFGDLLELAYARSPVQRQSGQNLPVTLAWRVLRDPVPGESVSIFAHLLDPGGQLVAQRDLLAFPIEGWQAGDVFIQLQDISLEGVAAGKRHLQIGVYSLVDGARYPVMLDGAAVGDRLLLEPVDISD